MGFYYEDLPKQREKRYCPVWALIDMDYRSEQPPISGTSNIVPIQASPQGSVLWKSWKKQYRAALFGMPLWSMEELIEGYVYDLFSLYAIDPSHVVQWRFVADCLLPFAVVYVFRLSTMGFEGN